MPLLTGPLALAADPLLPGLLWYHIVFVLKMDLRVLRGVFKYSDNLTLICTLQLCLWPVWRTSRSLRGCLLGGAPCLVVED